MNFSEYDFGYVPCDGSGNPAFQKYAAILNAMTPEQQEAVMALANASYTEGEQRGYAEAESDSR